MEKTTKSDANEAIRSIKCMGYATISRMGDKTLVSVDGINHRITDLTPEETEALFAPQQNRLAGLEDYMDQWFSGEIGVEMPRKSTPWLQIAAYGALISLLAINAVIYAFGG